MRLPPTLVVFVAEAEKQLTKASEEQLGGAATLVCMSVLMMGSPPPPPPLPPPPPCITLAELCFVCQVKCQ